MTTPFGVVIFLAAGEGFEPSHTESESAVLPLHNPAVSPALHSAGVIIRKKRELVNTSLRYFFTEYGAYFSRRMAEGLHGSGGQSRRSVKKTGEKGSRSSPFFPVLCAFYPSNSFQKIYITQANNTIYNALFTSSTGLSTGIRPDTSGIFPLFHAVFHSPFSVFARSPPGSGFT